MRYSIVLWCIIIYAQPDCFSAQLKGEDCEEIQEAGQALAQNVHQFDQLLQELMMGFFEESRLIIKSSLEYMAENVAGITPASSSSTTPIESDAHLTHIISEMSQQLDASFDSGFNEFFTLLKKGGELVVGDPIVVDALVKYHVTGRKRRRRRRTTLNSIDDKIKTLRQDMNTSLNGVERNFNIVSQQIFVMLVNSLKELSDDKDYQANLDNEKVNMLKYLLEAIQTIVGSHVERYYLIIENAAQQIEIIDSKVANIKKDPTQLANAIEPAKVFMDESIQKIKQREGAIEIKRQLKLKLDWIKSAFQDLKSKI